MTTELWIGLGSAVGGILLSLIVTTLFNKFISLPKKWRDERARQRQEKEELMATIEEQKRRIDCLEEQTSHYPEWRAQSRHIQDELRNTDNQIVELCQAIKDDVISNRAQVLEKLTRLEHRERNALRAKILEEHRLMTDERKNPNKAWTEMEHHAFFRLVEDYEELGGNDYVHSVVIPEMNRLNVIEMSDLEALKELFESRRI